MTEGTSTFAQAIRRYYEKYPEAGGAAAAEEVCKQLHMPCDEKKKTYARVLKNRGKATITAGKSDRSAARGGVVTDVVGFHRVTFGPVEVPGWLAAGIVEAAGRPEEVECHGWRRAGGRSKNGMLHCLIPGTEFRMVFYPSTGKLTVYAGDGELDREKREELRVAVVGNLASVVQPVVCASSDPPSLAENLRKVFGGLEGFVDGVLLAPDSRGYHMTWFREDFKDIGPFKMVWKDRGLAVRKDGSHPTCLEVEVSPTGMTDLRQRMLGLEKTLPEVVADAVERSVGEAVARGVGDALQTFSASFSEKFSGEFAKKMKELFEGGSAAQPQNSANTPADDRRYT